MARPAKLRDGRVSVCLVIPCHERVALATICLDQYKWVCDQANEFGVDMSAVVIADDENVDTAKNNGFYVVEIPNDVGLGTKFNEGYALAAQEGFDYVHATGSDTWVDPVLFQACAAGLPRQDSVLCSRYLSVINAIGKRRLDISIDESLPFGNSIVPISLFQECGYRPVDEGRPRGCDANTRRTLEKFHPEVKITYQVYHPLERMGFQTQNNQVTDYAELRRRHKGVEQSDPWQGLIDVYPSHFVERMKAHYTEQRKQRHA